ncbi:MAG: RagB/SusD family nutrient uptake outer membrane protein [Carboxylicivirga sp.]|jgi:hypothetical protein|nr:RagB/SusD family nutrient uptake outer membrane protein [Carboxylicivirga sp.]
MKRIIYYILILSISAGVISCEDKYLNIEPIDGSSSSTFFASANELQLAINSIYGRVVSVAPEGLPMLMLMDTWLTDNGLYRITNEQSGLRALSNSQQDPGSGFGKIYSEYYKSITRCNNMLENMNKAEETMSAEEYNDFRAQALTMRAYFYSVLVQLFGDVPYMDFMPQSPTDGFISRTSKTEVISNILSDLDDAANLINPGLTGAQERVTLTTIYALKARVALFAKEYGTAITAADNALSAAVTQGIALHSDYGELFQLAGEGVGEVLLHKPYNEDANVSTHFNLRMGSRFGHYSQTAPTQNLIDAYPTINGLSIEDDPTYDPTNPWENRDPRLRASVVMPQDIWGGIVYESHRDSLKVMDYRNDSPTLIDNRNCRSASWPACLTGYLWKKYVDESSMADGVTATFIDWIVLRLGEVYLIKAEAEIESNGDLQAAADALNKLRERAYGPAYPMVTVSDQTTMRKILRIERRVELANEGHRYTDGLRWGILENMRGEALIGRPMDLEAHSYIPTIDDDGVTHYAESGKSQYDDWRSLLLSDGSIDPTGYDTRLYGNWTNAVERNFTAPRDYLLPIPQEEIDLYEANGFVLTQNDGY